MIPKLSKIEAEVFTISGQEISLEKQARICNEVRHIERKSYEN